MKDKLTIDQAIEVLNTTLKKNDFEAFKTHLSRILENEGHREVAKRIDLRRETLYSSLKPTKKPAFTTIKSILDGVGLEISIQKRRE